MRLRDLLPKRLKAKETLPARIETFEKPCEPLVPVLLNGQEYLVPQKCSGDQIKEALGAGRDRLLVLHHIETQTVIHIHEKDIIDIPEGAEFEDLPIGKWGNIPYANRKIAEFRMVEEWYGGCDYDDDGLSWLRLNRLPLPPGRWNKPATGLLLTIPRLYPTIPPTGFYIDPDLRDHNGRSPAHVFKENPHSKNGWAFYCLMLESNWRPSPNIEDGDSLFKVIERIKAGLS